MLPADILNVAKRTLDGEGVTNLQAVHVLRDLAPIGCVEGKNWVRDENIALLKDGWRVTVTSGGLAECLGAARIGGEREERRGQHDGEGHAHGSARGGACRSSRGGRP